MWRTTAVDEGNCYADGKWRFCIYDVEFGEVSGRSDASVNTIKEDNYTTYGLLDMDTNNPAVLCFAYLMTNESFRTDFTAAMNSLTENNFEKMAAIAVLDKYINVYSPLYDQFFDRYDNVGSTKNSISGGYASYKCIKDFLELRADYIEDMLDWTEYNYQTRN